MLGLTSLPHLVYPFNCLYPSYLSPSEDSSSPSSLPSSFYPYLSAYVYQTLTWVTCTEVGSPTGHGVEVELVGGENLM